MERMERKRSISEISATGNGSQVPVSNASGAFVMTDYNADGMPYDSNNSVKDKIDSNASDISTLSGYVADISDVIPSTATESNKLATQSDIPTVGTAAALDVAASGDASSTQVVKGDDSRLTDARNAADVYSWAKASTKPSYTASEVGAVATTAVGSANGVAELDSTGKVPSSQLPSYVDDVLEYDSTSLFPATGEDGKIYIAKDTNKTYRWSGTTYVEISESLALGETSSTAYAGNKGKANADAIAAIKDGTNIDSFSDVETALDGKANVEQVYGYGDTWSAKTWSGLSSFSGVYIWSDGTDIYYSSETEQYVLDKLTSTWRAKTWSGLTSFNGDRIWLDGNNIYYSSSTSQYVLDKSTSTWTTKTWSGLTSFYGNYIWSDGTDIYYSLNSNQYVLDKSTSTWNTKTWSGLTAFIGNSIWSDGDNIYFSDLSNQYVLDKPTSTWNTKTWSGLTSFSGDRIWSDGDNIYYSNGSIQFQYVLDKSTSTWEAKTWSGLTSFAGTYVWSDGTDIYYSKNSDQYVLDKIANGVIIENSIIVKSNGDLQGAAEIYDAANNALSDKYDATSLTFPNERFTITASSWSSTQTSGYYTYTLSTGSTKYNTYSDVTMANVGVDDGTDATSAEKAAYALVNKFDMADGTGVDSFTLYAKTKPTTTFYIKLSGRYMAKNAASSSKALDIETANSLDIYDGEGNKDAEFNGSTNRKIKFVKVPVRIQSTDWSSTVNAQGYYTATVSLRQQQQYADVSVNTYCETSVRLGGLNASSDSLPIDLQIAAYNLIDYFYMADGTAVNEITAYAKTKPTQYIFVIVSGYYFG